MTTLPPALPEQAAPRRVAFPAWDWAWRNRHWTAPLAVGPAVLLLGAVLAHTPGAPVPTVTASAAAAGTVCAMAHLKWDRPVERWFARATIACLAAWLSTVAFTGTGMWACILGAAAWLAWSGPWWWHKHPRTHDTKATERWDAWWQYYARGFNLTGSRVIDVTTTGVVDTLIIQLWAGRQHAKDVEAAKPLIESALQGHVEAGRIRVETDKRNPSRALVHLKRENPLEPLIGWDPALQPASVTQPAPIGKDELGNWVYAPLLTNWFVNGMTRTGKSNELSALLAAWTNCDDAEPPWIIDLKGGRSARPWAKGSDDIATTKQNARIILRRAVAELKARAEDWYTGAEQAIPDKHTRAIVVVIDEPHELLAPESEESDAECRSLVRVLAAQGSGVNVHVWIFTQHGSLDSSVGSPVIRANCPSRMCFAVAEPSHGQFTLTDWNRLDASRLESKGSFYWQVGPDSPSSPARGPDMRHDLIRDLLDARPAQGRPPLRLWAAAWQAHYDARRSRWPKWARREPEIVTPLRPSPGPQEEPVPPIDVPDTPEDLAAQIDADMAELQSAATPPATGPATVSATAAGRKERFATLLQRAGPDGITAKNLAAQCGLGRTWTHQQLGALLDRGAITRITTGRYPAYTAIPGQDVWGALLDVWDATDRISEFARVKVSA